MNEILQENKLAAFAEGLERTKLPLLSSLLEEAKEVLSNSDFPTTRNEAWKYTRVGRIASIKSEKNGNILSTLPAEFNIDPSALTVVLENGKLITDLSNLTLEQGLTIKPLSECSADELGLIGKNVKLQGEIFNALNTLFMNEGLFIQIADKAQIEGALQIIHVTTGNATVSNIRHFIHCGRFAKASVIQGYFSKGSEGSFTNAITELEVEENAHLTIDKLQYEAEGNFQVATEQVAQAKDSTFTINTLTLNGTLVRNNLNIEVNGVNCATHLNGAYLLKENQHVDNHTIVDHKAPHCESNELYKGVVDDKATAVFNGKVFVRKDSQKINAFQSNGNVLLSDNATVNSKPELEIYADDVKCSHGSTTGQLDEEAVFYLRARGISERSARHLMVSAFIGDVIEKIDNEHLLEFTHKILKDRFGWDF
jgi:Fe-S cluster assembly protein SufD